MLQGVVLFKVTATGYEPADDEASVQHAKLDPGDLVFVAFEEWRVINNWPNYDVSSLGRVRRRTAFQNRSGGHILKPTPDNHGYPRVSFYCNGKRVAAKVHTLVCETFHGPQPTPLHEVAHADGDRANPEASNVRWDTKAGNHADKLRHGTHNRGERHGLSKITNEAAADIITRRALGETTGQLAQRYSLHRETIGKLLRGESWSWLPRPWPMGESGRRRRAKRK